MMNFNPNWIRRGSPGAGDLPDAQAVQRRPRLSERGGVGEVEALGPELQRACSP